MTLRERTATRAPVGRYADPITPDPYRAAQAARLPAGPVSPFTRRALDGTLPPSPRPQPVRQAADDMPEDWSAP